AAHRITLDVFWPTILPYELWIDLLERPELYVSEVEPSSPPWEGWARLADLPPGRGAAGDGTTAGAPVTGAATGLVSLLGGRNTFPLALWERGVADEEVASGAAGALDPDGPFRLSRRTAALVLDDYRQFQLVFRFELEAPAADAEDPAALSAAATDAILAINRDRALFANLGQAAWVERIRSAAREEVRRIVRVALAGDAAEAEVGRIDFVEEGTYPLTMTDVGHLGPLEAVFEHETPSQLRERPAITRDVDGAFGHFGWSYSVVAGVPADRADLLVPVLAFLQFEYFQLRYFRHYGVVSMQAAGAPERRRELERQAGRFERFTFHFQRFVLETERYVTGLRPLYGDAAARIRSLWNMASGVDVVRHAFETQRDYLQRRAARAEERALRRQGIALYIIALLGLLGLYPTADVVLSLRHDHPALTFGITAVCAAGVVVGLWLLLRPEDPS
ncbi:MAG TPA: hypothetical protein VKA44_06755, partial [Gemmatimonadota bacterium]|nr:hypothetical protein [Gemmatimonadota bacterium]